MEALVLIAFLAASAPASAGTGYSDADVREIKCDVLVRNAAGAVVTVAMPDLHVLRGAAAEGPFKPKLPPRASAIVCRRTSIVPAEHDEEVLGLGIPLFIAEAKKNGRLAVLEAASGSYRYRLVEGDFRGREGALIEQRIALYIERARRGK